MKRILLLVLILFLFNSCDRIAKVGIKSLGFSEEVEVLQNLFFEFDEELMLDGDMNQWESTAYMDFEPRIEGKFKWVGKKELIFSPSKPMKFGAKYKAKLNVNLLKRKKGKLDIDKNEEISFHTPFLKLNESQFFQTKNKLAVKENQILLSLNGKYDAHNIQEEIKLVQDTQELNFKTAPAENPNNIILVLEDKIDADAGEIKGTIVPTTENEAKFREKSYFNIKLASNDVLQILKTETSFKKLTGYIYVKTNQQIDLLVIEKNLKITPSINFKLEQADQGFRIKGDFNQDDLYNLSISKNIVGVSGGKLDEDYETEAFFGKVNPYLEFTNKKAQYLSSLGNKNIGISIVNVPKINVKISKIYENNLLPFLKGNNNTYYDESEEQEVHNYTDENNLYSDVMLDKKIETETLPKKQGVSILNLPMPDHKKSKGIFFISVRSEDEYYRSVQKIVSMSDIGLIAKMSQNKEDLIIFANSIIDTKPIANLEIKLIGNSNQEMAKANTDASGIIVFKDIKKKFPINTLAMITASNTNDFNYILLDETLLETSKFNLAGKNTNDAGLDAFIYGDREIYRPGEMVNLNVVMRNTNWIATENVPIKIEIKQPNGKVVSKALLNTNKNGAIPYGFKLDRAAFTGFYSIDVFTGNDILIGFKNISVEDFMPDRIKVNLAGPDRINVGEKYALKIAAFNLFGPPANDKKYECDYSIKRKIFSPAGYSDFDFGVLNTTKYENELRTASTDAKGESLQEFDIPTSLANSGLLEGKTLVSVFDETGRPVHRLKTFEIITQKQFFGIKIPGYFVGTNTSMPIEYAALNAEGKKVNAKAIVDVYLLDYQTILEKTDNGLRYISKKKEKLLKTQEINFNSKNQIQSFVPKVSGEYEIRISETGKESYVSTNFYAYGGGTKASFEVDTDGEIKIETDKKQYNLGETAKAIFKTPFDGKLLITIETNGILEHKYLNTNNKSAEISIKLTESHLPNAYITATLIRPMNQPELPLMSAHGIVSIKVDDKSRIVPISISANTKVRSKTHQKINVKTNPGTELTIAVVDEGILQLKNTETPKISEFFYQERALGVVAYDLYPLLLPEIQLNGKASPGGDGSRGKRVNPLANGRAELVAKWSGQLVADAQGNTSFEFDIPEFLGSLRVMVVAYKGNNFGSAEEKITVSDPVSISVGMPMFLSPSDKVTVPVSFFNTTDQVQDISISSSVEGEIKRTEFTQKQLKLNPGAELQAIIQIEALEKIGLGKLKVMAQNKTETFSKSTEISVRPAGSLQKMGESGIIAKDKEVAFTIKNDFLPGSLSSKIYVSNTPMMQFNHRLEDLMEYPHGCMEQTISKAFPQLYLDELLTAMNSNVITESGNSQDNPQFNVKAAIDKIEANQLDNGSLAYWPGLTDGQWWVSAYGLHFLLEAKKSGFEVSENVLNRLTNFITQKTNEEESMEKIWLNNKNKLTEKERLRSEMAYSLYVLSLTESPNISAMNLYKTEIQKLNNEGQFLLACAYKQVGDDETYGKMLPKNFQNDIFDRMLYGSFSSPYRSLGLVLNTLVETDATNPQISKLSTTLNSLLSNKLNYFNTQELAFSMMAFGKILNKSKTKGKVELYYEDKLVQTLEGKDQWINMSKYPNGLKIRASNANMYYYYENEGIRKTNTFVQEDKFLKVRRAYFTRTGEIIKNPVFTQNQLIVVQVAVSTQAGLAYSIDNVVMTDMIPAGFEIENPRLVEDRDMPWIKNAATPSYFDIRDDRINYYVDVDKTEKYYYYLARAITKGTFIQGPVSADAMYNGTFRSYWGGGKVEIK